MDNKEQLIRETVCEFLSHRVKESERHKTPRIHSLQFTFYNLRVFITSKLNITLGAAIHGGPFLPDEEHTYLHSYLNDLLVDRILMQVFEHRQRHGNSSYSTFQITPYGVKCIREGQLKPARPTLHTMFDSLQLHPWVLEVSEQDFKSGHYDQAIFEAYKMIANKVKEKTGLESDGGQGLMGEVFSESNPKLEINPLASESDKNEQKGFKLLFMGAMTGIRNPPAHDQQRVRDPYETLH